MTSLADAASIGVDLVTATDSECTFAFVVSDENGLAVDFSGSTFELRVKARDDNGNPIGSVELTLTTGAGIDGDVSVGEFQPTFPSESAYGLSAGPYVYEVRRLVSAVAVEVFMGGNLDVEQGLS